MCCFEIKQIHRECNTCADVLFKIVLKDKNDLVNFSCYAPSSVFSFR